MKIGIDCGHNCPPDIGATGLEQEDKLTLAVGSRVMASLRRLGHEVINCTPNSATSVSNSLVKRCAVANSNNIDSFVSIHFNAFNGQAHGTEIFAISDKGRKLAQSVLAEIVKLGFFNRGVKDGSHLYVLRETNAPAILVECCFVDSIRDMKIYDPDKMASAILSGLVGELPESPAGEINKWQQLICALNKATIECPALKPAQLAQAILESGRGQSKLAQDHNNFWGLKWRREMARVADSVSYRAWDGTDAYCKFPSVEQAIIGYWVFLNRHPYIGWRAYGNVPEKYLEFIVKAGYCPDAGYLDKVIELLPEAQRLLGGGSCD